MLVRQPLQRTRARHSAGGFSAIGTGLHSDPCPLQGDPDVIGKARRRNRRDHKRLSPFQVGFDGQVSSDGDAATHTTRRFTAPDQCHSPETRRVGCARNTLDPHTRVARHSWSLGLIGLEEGFDRQSLGIVATVTGLRTPTSGIRNR